MFNALLLIGLAIGIFNIIFVLGLCRAAKRADRCLEEHNPRLLGNESPQRLGDTATSPDIAHGQSAVRPTS